MLVLFALLSAVRLGFGFERVKLPLPGPDPENYHHEGITRQGAGVWGGGSYAPATNALAFHCDYVDAYNYNPVWWLGGGKERIEAAMSTQHLLANMHFDDLASTVEIEAAFRRYTSGAVCGLLWAYYSDLDPVLKVSCAHNIVGVGLHAIQDFYSHSTWIDQGSRRGTTWFEADEGVRHGAELYTGFYEQAPQHGHKPHGTYEFACSIINSLGPLRGLLRGIGCHAASPLTKSSLCRAVRRCDSGVPVRIPTYGELSLPEGIAYVSPGINVDSRWQAGVAVQNRDLVPPIGPHSLFDTAYHLATRATCQWLAGLDDVMRDAAARDPETGDGLAAWWAEVKSAGVSIEDYTSDTAPFERFDLMPYQFMAAGPYPPPGDDAGKWYLRLEVTTGDHPQANTNATIVPEVDGVMLEPLDYGPRPTGSAVDDWLGYNDFTRGSTAAYMVGPLDALPATVVLHNTAPSLVDVLVATVDAIVELFTDAVDWLLGLIGSLLGMGADFVATSSASLRASELDALPAGGTRAFSIGCDGGGEGHYRVDGTVTYLAAGAPTGPNGYPTRRYRVAIDTLHCVRESDWDRASDSDEPFVVGLVLGHGTGQQHEWRTPVYPDVDSGDSVAVGLAYEVEIPERFGMITVPVAVWEHDDETSAARDAIQHRFAIGTRDRLEPHEKSLLVTLGESMGQAWQLHSLGGTAFRRGPHAEVATFGAQVMDTWVDGGETSPPWLPEPSGPLRSVPVPTSFPGCQGPTGVPDPPPDEDHGNPDSDPDGQPYAPGMFDGDL